MADFDTDSKTALTHKDFPIRVLADASGKFRVVIVTDDGQELVVRGTGRKGTGRRLEAAISRGGAVKRARELAARWAEFEEIEAAPEAAPAAPIRMMATGTDRKLRLVPAPVCVEVEAPAPAPAPVAVETEIEALRLRAEVLRAVKARLDALPSKGRKTARNNLRALRKGTRPGALAALLRLRFTEAEIAALTAA